MNMDKNMLLVKMVEKFPCLYKSDTVEYSTRSLTDQAWLKVSKELDLTVQECKEKWKNLRYGLLRSFRPSRHGSAKKKYYLHDDMAYLIPYLTSISKSKVIKANHVEELEDSNIEDHEDPLERDSFDMTQFVESYSDDEEPLKKKTKTYETQFNNNNYNKPDQSIDTRTFEEDPRRMFLLSLLPEIADFSDSQMKTFRRRIFGLLDEINELDNNFTVKKSEAL